jgi:hypothetical protein
MSSHEHMTIYIVTILSDNRQGFALEIEFIDDLQVITICNYNTIADFHTLQINTAHAKSFSLLCLHHLFPGNGF